jgi:hypothetical protein
MSSMNGRSDEDVVREAFGRLVADEPASTLRADAVVQQGRRIRRRHRARVVLPAVTLSVLAVAAGAVTVVDGGDGGGPAPSAPDVSPVAASAPLSDEGRKVVEGIAGSKDPARASATLGADLRYLIFGGDGGAPGEAIGIWRTSWGAWEAKVVGNDAAPAAHVGFGITKEPGMLTVHPCEDPEFVDGATCTETTLTDGSYLTRRGLVDHDGVRSLYASITRDDGTGVFAESGNYVTADDQLAADDRVPTPGTSLSPEEKRLLSTPRVVREDPVLTTAQLVGVVRSLARSNDVGTFPID